MTVKKMINIELSYFGHPYCFNILLEMKYNATKWFKLYIHKKYNLVVLALKLELKVKIICTFKGIFTEKLWLVFLFDPCPLWLSHDNSWNFDIKDRKILIQKVKNSPLLGSPNERKLNNSESFLCAVYSILDVYSLT